MFSSPGRLPPGAQEFTALGPMRRLDVRQTRWSGILVAVTAALGVVAGASCGQRKAVTATPSSAAAAPNAATAAASTAAAAKPATSAPAATRASGGKFDGSKWGFTAEYPAGWTLKPSQNYEMFLVPAGTAQSDTSVSVDVPDLPPHIPGMIPFRLVKNGYTDDLTKSHPDVQTRDETAPPVPNAKAALVTSTWKVAGKPVSETALILLHADHVYIIRAHDDPSTEKETRAAFDAVVKSLNWTKSR